jgi:hypothetical protein
MASIDTIILSVLENEFEKLGAYFKLPTDVTDQLPVHIVTYFQEIDLKYLANKIAEELEK